MSSKSTREIDALDLAIGARRGEFARGDQRAFEQALGVSAALRTAFEIGCDFDLASRIRPGDEALVARAAERALARSLERPPRRLKLTAVLLAASLAVASVAAATRAVLSHRVAPGSVAAARAPTPPRKAAVPVAQASPLAVSLSPAGSAQASAVLPSAAASLPRPSGHVVRELPKATVAVATVSADTAEQLLERAGAARRTGAFATARALYLELQLRFPGSTEARVSYVSLGKLLLGAGRAQEADVAFSHYLGGGAGQLREEALVGRADALFALGRTQEERGVRQELIRLYPTSVYAARARERVTEIERARDAGLP